MEQNVSKSYHHTTLREGAVKRLYGREKVGRYGPAGESRGTP
jgi:hypothetical protein